MKVGAKEYLQSYRRLERTIEQKRWELAALQQSVSGIRAAGYDSVPVRSSGEGRQMEERVVRCMELSNTLQEEIARAMELRDCIVRQIQGMDSPAFSQILYQRYVAGDKLDKIARQMQYSYTYVRHLHGWALAAFQRQYEP
ncbi:MAG: hypothetical protein LUE91_05425 [Oscillospiraceae bacterium]|nr:hypothetical protein [Oscillospiraceae bacterium]